jgi:hypothetical protein
MNCPFAVPMQDRVTEQRNIRADVQFSKIEARKAGPCPLVFQFGLQVPDLNFESSRITMPPS